jgi:hypothetical protein
MMGDRPTIAFVLGFVGGMIILVSGVLVGVILLVAGTLTLTPPGPAAVFAGLFSILDGVVVIIGSTLTYVNPRNHTIWGILVSVLSVASWITPSYGGFLVGLILGLAGGILAITWKESISTHLKPQNTLSCPNCGKLMDANANYCSNCAKPLH